jgi:hypothetical protein
MRCEEFEARLQELLDQRRHPNFDALASRHARMCPECRELLVVYGIVLDEVRFLDVPPPANDLAERVLDEVLLSPRRERPRYLSPLVWVTAAAVAILVVGRRADEPRDLPAPVANAPQSSPGIERHRDDIPVPAVGALAQEATARYADLARDASGAISQVAWLLPGNSTRAVDAASRPEVSAPGNLLNGASTMTEVAAGFKPLADSTTGAVGFLLQVLPMGPPRDNATGEPKASAAVDARAI